MNGSNRSSKIPGENSEGNYLSKLQYATQGFRCEKVSSYLPSKGFFFFFPNYLFCVILQGEHVLSIYVQNVISAFYLFVHEQVTNTNVLQLATLWLLLYYLKQKNKNKKSP